MSLDSWIKYAGVSRAVSNACYETVYFFFNNCVETVFNLIKDTFFLAALVKG